ncbi:MAG: aspartate kinase [Anaerolineae bacterium]
MACVVMKFGGSLTASADLMQRIVQITQIEFAAWERVVVVVSAMAGVTDALLNAAEAAVQADAATYRRITNRLLHSHSQMIADLFGDGIEAQRLMSHIQQHLQSLLHICDAIVNKQAPLLLLKDQVMALGECMIAPILTALMQREGLRAVQVDPLALLITDNTHQHAHPVIDLVDTQADLILKPLLDAGVIPVVPGFIGKSRSGNLTTLGRGGSDLTATVLGAALDADEVWIWTYVDGIMSADPALVPNARVIPALTYDEVNELSYFGARVIHPGAIEPLVGRGIPLRVRSPFNLDHAGTLIQAEAPAEFAETLKAVTAVDGLCLNSVNHPFDLVSFLGKVRDIVGAALPAPSIVMQSHQRATLVFVVPTSEGPSAVSAIASNLTQHLPDWEVLPVKVIAAIGAFPSTRLTVDGPIRPIAAALGADNRLLIAVRTEDVQAAVRQLHWWVEQGAPSAGILYPRRMLSSGEETT